MIENQSLLLAAADALPPAWRLITKFLYFAGLAAAMGASVLFVAAVRPALRLPDGSPSDRAVLRRRSALLLAWAGIFLLATLYPQLAGKVARAGTGMEYGAALSSSAIGNYLSAPGETGQWVAPATLTAIQFAGPAICGLGLASLLIPRVRRFLTPIGWVAAVGIPASVLVTILPTDFSAATPSDWVSTILTDLHPMSGCIWVGGLISLSVLAASRPRLSESAGVVWAVIWKRFSFVAQVCVGVTLASGLFLSWQVVGSLPEMWQTTFGRVLSLKILLVLALIAIGTYNEFVLLPRVARLREEGDRARLFGLVLRHFPKTVAAEAAIGIAVLAVIPFLYSSAREQAGTSADPGDPAGVFAAVAILIALGALAFVAGARVHAVSDHPRRQLTSD